MVIEKIGNLLKEDVFVVAHQTNFLNTLQHVMKKELNCLDRFRYWKASNT